MSEPAKRVENFSGIDESMICYWKQLGRWFINFPDEDLLGDLSNHTVEEHEDGTITVTPSILVTKHNGKQRHGYLTRGVWNEC